jgi:hypothetical protein
MARERFRAMAILFTARKTLGLVECEAVRNNHAQLRPGFYWSTKMGVGCVSEKHSQTSNLLFTKTVVGETKATKAVP